MSRRRPDDFDLRAAIEQVNFTPGRRDLDGLLALLGDEAAVDAAERSLLRAGDAAGRFLDEKYLDTTAPIRARVVRAIGRLAQETGADAWRAWLLARLDDPDAKARRNAIIALGKIGGEGTEDALLASWERETEVFQRRSIAEALGKAGGPRAVELLRRVESDDAELSRIVAAALLRLGGRTTRAPSGTSSASIDLDAESRDLDLVLRCRHGLEEIVCDEAPRSWGARPAGAGVVRARFSGRLRSIFDVRTALGFGFAIPGRGASVEEAVADAVTSDAARRVFESFSRGGVRYRLDWERGGKRRATVFRCAEAIAARRPDLVNDPSERTWEVVIVERAERVEVELSPRVPDPRFAYRVRDVPAASHPTLAAALARLADVRPEDVVWDPFTGSATELIECARLGARRLLLGTDRDPQALEAARANVQAAGFAIDVRPGDALVETPPGTTLIITNPPMGHRVHRHQDLREFFDRFVDHAARVLVPGGRLVWISPHGDRTAARAARAGLRVILRRRVDMGGFDGDIQIAAKAGARGR